MSATVVPDLVVSVEYKGETFALRVSAELLADRPDYVAREMGRSVAQTIRLLAPSAARPTT